MATGETIFTWGAPPLKFGAGAVDEIGFELSALGAARVLIVTDPGIAALGLPQRVADNLRRYGVEAEIFDGVHVEPTDDSMTKAIEYARAQGPWDGFVAVGGGSAIDTAKAVNLLTSHPGELMDYVNRPIGAAKVPPRAAQAPRRDPDDRRHRLGVHGDVRARHPVDEGQDRDQPLAAAPDARGRRPAADDDAAARGHRGVGDGHRVPRLESYTARHYTDFERKQPEERVHLLRLEPVSRPVVREGDGAAGDSRSATAVREGGRRRGALEHDDGGDVRRHGLRQLRRAHPARQRLPDRRAWSRTSARPATRGTSRWCRTGSRCR